LIYDLRDFILASQSYGTSINWNMGLQEAVDIDAVTGKMTISTAFAEHVWHLENWSFSAGFAAVFPELRRRYRILPGFSVPVSKVNVQELLERRDKIFHRIKEEKT
jgi:hypothetical protein